MESGEGTADEIEHTTGPGSDHGGRIRCHRPRRRGRRSPPGRSGRSDRSAAASSKRAIRLLSVSVPVGILSVVGLRVAAYGRRIAAESGGGSGIPLPIDTLDPLAVASIVQDASLAAGVIAALMAGAFVLLVVMRITVKVTR